MQVCRAAEPIADETLAYETKVPFPHSRDSADDAAVPPTTKAPTKQDVSLVGAQTQDDNTPGALNWVLAVVLGATLLVSLVRVCRVLQMAEAVTPRRHVPEGMRHVECGACRRAQYVTTQGRFFVCFLCQSANRVPVDVPRLDGQELIAPTGPLRSYEFKKGGDNYWQETKQENIEEGADTTEALAQITQPTIFGRTSPADDTTRESSECESNASGRSSKNCDIPQCVICLDKLGCMVLLPCAHGSVCEECSTRIAQNRASGGAHCPHCRSTIKTLVKIRQIDGSCAKGIEYRIPMARLV